MFNLGEEDLGCRILGCGDGPAGFNAAMNARGFRVVSCDPLYAHSREEIAERIRSARVEVMVQVRANQSNFVWDSIRDPDELEQVRLKAMHEFLLDYDQGKKEGRYISCCLPDLPFDAGSFDLALCSHLLFLYPRLGPDFHLDSLREMLRVSREVRVYPLVDLDCTVPPLVGDILGQLRRSGYTCSLERVRSHFLRNGDRMLRIVPGTSPHSSRETVGNCPQDPGDPSKREGASFSPSACTLSWRKMLYMRQYERIRLQGVDPTRIRREST